MHEFTWIPLLSTCSHVNMASRFRISNPRRVILCYQLPFAEQWSSRHSRTCMCYNHLHLRTPAPTVIFGLRCKMPCKTRILWESVTCAGAQLMVPRSGTLQQLMTVYLGFMTMTSLEPLRGQSQLAAHDAQPALCWTPGSHRNFPFLLLLRRSGSCSTRTSVVLAR